MPRLKKTDPVEKILLRQNKITEKALKEIKANHLHSGQYLGKTLVDHGYVHTQTLLATLGEELSIPVLNSEDFLKHDLPIPDLNISEAFLKEKVIFPLRLEHDVLTIVLFDPFDFFTIENLRISQDKEIKIALAPEQVILEAIEAHYGGGGSVMDRMVGKV